METAAGSISHFENVAKAIAHEIIHVAQFLNGETTGTNIHNADFKRKAARVCKEMGWDPKEFC